MTTQTLQSKDTKKRNPHATQNRIYRKYMDQLVTVHLLSGLKVTGKLLEYDQYSIAVSVKKDEILIFKNSIALLRPYNLDAEKKDEA